MSTEKQIKDLVKKNGAAVVGIASQERLSSAPPSGDGTYLLPSARSIVSFTMPISPGVIREYLAKKNWLAFGAELKRIDQQLYRISDKLADYLMGLGHEAKVVDLNQVYRPEPGGTGAKSRVAYIPDFSHRYAAVAAGLGWLGWSGHLITEEFGGSVLLGSVLTSAELKSDPMLTSHEDRCENCKVCTAVCPTGYFSSKEAISVQIGGMNWPYAKRGVPMRCGMGCNGYHGLHPSGKWSTWSPYRLPQGMPADDTVLNELSRRIRDIDPEKDRYSDYSQREYCSDPDLIYPDTCANCQVVCWKDKEERIENLRILSESGVVVLKGDGNRIAVNPVDATVINTSFGLNVALLKKESGKLAKDKMGLEKDQIDYVYPLDAILLTRLGYCKDRSNNKKHC